MRMVAVVEVAVVGIVVDDEAALEATGARRCHGAKGARMRYGRRR